MQVVNAIIGGHDPTTSVLSRILQVLGYSEGEGLVDTLLQELNENVTTGEEYVD